MNHLPRASELGLIHCHVCGMVCCHVSPGEATCPRCGVVLRERKLASYARSWALLVAGFLFYIPANVLPIMRTASLGNVDDNTILSGVIELWIRGSPGLAIIVFTASILVPMTKFFVLAALLVSARHNSDWARPQRAKLYRLVEIMGYWSMLDVFIVALLATLVHFGIFSLVAPLPGVIFFGLTVVMTMLASTSFDPRMIWDDERQR